MKSFVKLMLSFEL